MLRQQMSTLNGIWTSCQLTPRLLRYQGFGGLFGFMRGMSGNGRAGKATASTFLSALAAGDAAAAGAFLEDAATVELPPGTTVGLPELAAGTRDLQWKKMIGAGDYATATITLGPKRGVAMFRFDRRADRISGLQIFI
jgi:hypothetical protein